MPVLFLACLTRRTHGLFYVMAVFRDRPAWRHYVAVGDSLTAGRGDFAADGRPIGWAQRLGNILTERTGIDCQVTNLAVDGSNVRTVLTRQVPEVAALAPDLISVTVGMNDIRLPVFSPEDFSTDLDLVLGRLAATGATVMTCTLPDIASVVELPAEYVAVAHQRLRQAGDIIRDSATKHAVLCLDVWAMSELANSPELFTADRLHPNTSGHRLLATAFADLLLPG